MNQKFSQEFNFVTEQGHEKLGQKIHCSFQIRPPKKDPLTCCKKIH